MTDQEVEIADLTSGERQRFAAWCRQEAAVVAAGRPSDAVDSVVLAQALGQVETVKRSALTTVADILDGNA